MEDENSKEYIQNKMKSCIDQLEYIDDLIRSNKLQNEQWVLDYQDKLNEISVRF